MFPERSLNIMGHPGTYRNVNLPFEKLRRLTLSVQGSTSKKHFTKQIVLMLNHNNCAKIKS
jgi:hypothetical protein